MENDFDEIRKNISRIYKKYPNFYSSHIFSNLNWKRYIDKIQLISGLTRSNKVKVLDMGCGDGHTTAMASNLFSDSLILGSDLKTNERRKELWNLFSNNAIFLISDSLKTPFKNESFDIIFSFGVMEHVSDDYEFLKEIYRILKNNGRNIIFNLPNEYSLSENFSRRLKKIYSHEQTYNKKKLYALFKEAGFCDIEIKREDFIPGQLHLLGKTAGYFSDKYYGSLDIISRYLNKTPLNLFSQSFSIIGKK